MTLNTQTKSLIINLKTARRYLAAVAFVGLLAMQPQAVHAQVYDYDYDYDYGGGSSSYSYTPSPTPTYEYTSYDYGGGNGSGYSSNDYGSSTNYGSGSSYVPTPNYEYGNYEDPYNIPTEYTPTATNNGTNSTNYSEPSPFWTPDENTVVVAQFVPPAPPVGFPIFGAPTRDAGFGSNEEGNDKPQLPSLPTLPILNMPGIIVNGMSAVANWIDSLISNNSDNAEGGGKNRPSDPPTGTIPINQGGYTRGQIHEGKAAVGAGADDWVGVAPGGEIITSTPRGGTVHTGVNIGDFKK